MKPSIFGLGIAAAFMIGLVIGSSHEPSRQQPTAEPKAAPALVCLCGMEQSCPFGPGIVGRQHCESAFDGWNRWSRCEPVPAVRP